MLIKAGIKCDFIEEDGNTIVTTTSRRKGKDVLELVLGLNSIWIPDIDESVGISFAPSHTNHKRSLD